MFVFRESERYGVQSLASELDVSTSTVHAILKTELGMSTCARTGCRDSLGISSGKPEFAARKSSSAGMSVKAVTTDETWL